MNKTFCYKISTVDQVGLFDEALSGYTGLFYKVYNNLELCIDKVFIKDCLGKFGFDKTIYDYCVVDAKAQYEGFEQIKKEKEIEIEDINKRLKTLAKRSLLDKWERKHKRKLLQTKAFLLRTKDKNICFGGKDLLRNITRLRQKEHLTKKETKLLASYRRKFASGRKRGIFLWGKAIEGGNRKSDFHLDENYITLKINKKTKIKITVVPFESKRRACVIAKINQMVLSNALPITLRITKTHVYFTFDNEILSGFSFDIQAYNEKIKNHPRLDKKRVRREFQEKRTNKKLCGKIKIRTAGVDFNPHEIGFSISDVDKKGEIKETIYGRSFDLSYFTKQKNISHKDREKLKYELAKIYDFIFNACTHYNVSCFGYEDLLKITKTKTDNAKEFNRITKNIWNRGLQCNLIKSRCDELGIICNEVQPGYSSFIGNIKHDAYDCIASSIEISRRAYVKYIKNSGNHLYPSLNKEDYEKMSYLIGQDMSKYKTWVSLHKRFNANDVPRSGGWWRNKNSIVGEYLFSKKSNVAICY